MSEQNPPAEPAPLHCAFCGAVWDSGLFFGARVYARPAEQNRNAEQRTGHMLYS